MGFLDELRSQSKSKEDIAREKKEKQESDKLEKEERRFSGAKYEWSQLFEMAEVKIKECITKDAQTVGYQSSGGKKVIQGSTTICSCDEANLALDPYAKEIRAGGVFTAGLLGTKNLYEASIKAHYPDLVKAIFHDAIQKLKSDGIEATFTVDWQAYDGVKHHVLVENCLFERIIEGYRTRKWLPYSSMIWNCHFGGKYFSDTRDMLRASLTISCIYRCEF